MIIKKNHIAISLIMVFVAVLGNYLTAKGVGWYGSFAFRRMLRTGGL